MNARLFLSLLFDHHQTVVSNPRPRDLVRANLIPAATMVPLVSVAGYISLLTEPEPELQAQALVNLNDLVDQFWMEIAEHGSIMYEYLSMPSLRSGIADGR